MTLPTRLRPYHDFEASLAGDDGVHKIFELQSTIVPDDEVAEHSTQGPKTHADQVENTEGPKPQTTFELDFTYNGLDSNTAHIFNQLQVSRGITTERKGQSPTEDLGTVRRQRLYNSEPMFQR